MITILDFDKLKITTMTVLVYYDVLEINLNALFLLLPISRIIIPSDYKLCKKQGKIIPPIFLNEDGIIISMRFDKKARGIIRSLNTKTFLHAIIMDVGTNLRIISLKLTRGTIELTGVTSYEMALQYSNVILQKIVTCQNMINKIRENIVPLEDIITLIEGLDVLPDVLGTIFSDKITSIHEEYYQFIYSSRVFDSVPKFIEYANYVLSFVKRSDLSVYTTSNNSILKINRYESIMVNICFNLGFCVKQTKLAEIMNAMPFVCNFNNARDGSAVTILYHYVKDKDNIKQSKNISKHTIVVYGSGYSKFSGPDLEHMKPVYNTFMHRILLNYNQFYKLTITPVTMKVITIGRALSIREFNAELTAIEEYNNKIRNCELSMVSTVSNGSTEESHTSTSAVTPIIDITEKEFDYDD